MDKKQKLKELLAKVNALQKQGSFGDELSKTTDTLIEEEVATKTCRAIWSSLTALLKSSVRKFINCCRCVGVSALTGFDNRSRFLLTVSWVVLFVSKPPPQQQTCLRRGLWERKGF